MGIPPAPRGLPQIEVSFDIDADGILNVSAKDKGTGKEQNIVIQSSGGLSDDDIEQMVRDAEANADADAKRKQNIEVKNEIDSLVYSTEKSLKEHEEKLDDETKKEVETAIKEANDAKEGDDFDLITEKSKALQEASLKIGKAIYGQGDAASQGEAGAEGAEEGAKDNNTVDAEFEEKSEEKKEEAK